MSGFGLVESLILIVSLGIIGQLFAWRLRIPSIVVLIILGLVIGPLLGLVNPQESFGDSYKILIELGVAIILFEGGLNLRLFEFKEAGGGVRRLISVGLILNWLFGSAFAHFVGGFSWEVSAFFGAILVVTGPTVIMPALRQARLHRRPASYLKWEGIINDPLGALLAVITYEYLIYSDSGSPLMSSLFGILIALVYSFLMAVAMAYVIKIAFQKHLVPDFLKVPIILSLVLVLFELGNSLQDGSGLLVTTLFGMVLGNMKLQGIEDLRRFKESLSIFILSIVFLVLAASLDIDLLRQLNLQSILYIVCVLFVIRPIAIFLSTLGSEMNWKEKFIVSWFAPRGIVSISVAGTLGPRLADFGIQDAEYILPLIFSIVFLTVLIYGLSLSKLARLLSLSAREKRGLLIVGAGPWNTELAKTLKDSDVPIIVSDTSKHRLKRAKKQGIECHEGPILVTIEDGVPNLSTYRYLFVGTENDAYNSMVCTKIGNEIGRKNCFQVPPHTEDDKSFESLPADLKGQVLEDERLSFENLMKNHYRGWKFKKQTVTEEMLDEDSLNKIKNSEESIPILCIHKNSMISFFFTQLMKPLEPGDTLIFYSKD